MDNFKTSTIEKPNALWIVGEPETVPAPKPTVQLTLAASYAGEAATIMISVNGSRPIPLVGVQIDETGKLVAIRWAGSSGPVRDFLQLDAHDRIADKFLSRMLAQNQEGMIRAACGGKLWTGYGERAERADSGILG